MSKKIRIALTNILLLASAPAAYYITKSTNSSSLLSDFFFQGINFDLNSQQGKLHLLFALFSRIAVFLFIHTTLVMLLRVITNKVSPVISQDPKIIQTLNRVILVVVEQSIIFGGLYSYFLLYVSGDRFNTNQLVTLASWYLLARTLHSIGYTLGIFTEIPTLRSLGVVINFIANLILLQNILLTQTYLTPLIFGQ